MSLSLNFLTLGLYMDMRHWCMKYQTKGEGPLWTKCSATARTLCSMELSSRSPVPGGRISAHTTVHLLQTSRDIKWDRGKGRRGIGAWQAVAGLSPELRWGCAYLVSISAQQQDWRAAPVSSKPEEGLGKIITQPRKSGESVEAAPPTTTLSPSRWGTRWGGLG